MHAHLALLVLLAGTTIVCAAPVEFSSGTHHVALLELYTSEGCSSCPPAEAWFGKLAADERLWKEFVPVAFHVSYWDRLGWRDRFARESFTRRQYALAASWGTKTVYTPCFARDGREWRERDLAAPPPTVAGRLTGVLEDDATLTVVFAPPGDVAAGALDAHVALLACAVRTDVRRGENAGRTLEHTFVAAALHDLALTRGTDGTWRGRLDQALAGHDATAGRHAIALWVTRPGAFTPLQAAGGWLP